MISKKPLKISILEKGSVVKRQYKKTQWIIRLDTSNPNRLNVDVSGFGSLYFCLSTNLSEVKYRLSYQGFYNC